MAKKQPSGVFIETEFKRGDKVFSGAAFGTVSQVFTKKSYYSYAPESSRIEVTYYVVWQDGTTSHVRGETIDFHSSALLERVK